jgi:hypothetical protein
MRRRKSGEPIEELNPSIFGNTSANIKISIERNIQGYFIAILR